MADGRVLTSKELESTKDLAFTFRKYLNDRYHNDDEIEIHDPALLKQLQTSLRHYPGHALSGETPTLHSPFESIILNWDKLEKIASAAKPDDANNQTQSDLELLLTTISKSSSDRRLDQLLKNRAVNMEQKRVTFESIWTIFPPGEIIFGTPFQNQPQVFIVIDNLNPWPKPESRGKSAPWALKCWMYDWTGQAFLRTILKIKIDRFEGAKPINTLPYYPLRFHEKPGDIEDTLWKRGKNFRNLCIAQKGEQMFHYNGGATLSRKRLVDASQTDSSVRSSYLFFRYSTNCSRTMMMAILTYPLFDWVMLRIPQNYRGKILKSSPDLNFPM